MNLNWKRKDFKEDIDFILVHQQNGTPEFWHQELFTAYPDLDYEYAKSLPERKRFEYITKQIEIQFKKRQNIIGNSIKMFEEAWAPIAGKLNAAYSSAFDNDCAGILNDMTALVGMNPICPTSIADHTFDIFHHFEKNSAMSTALHEITHLVWFYFWHKHFNDNPTEYDAPQLKWLLSEIVVDTVIRNSPINDLIAQPKYIAYQYFYDMTVGGILIFDTMKTLYTGRKNIYNFMEKSFEWIKSKEPDLRAKIAVAEK